MFKNRLISYMKLTIGLLAASLSTHVSAGPSANRNISYLDVGRGTPLVLIHAFPTDQQLWQPQREGLKNHFRVITLDLWGFGQSSPVNGQAMTMSEYADEIKQLLDQLHIKKAIVGGESMGGYIALAFSEKYPERLTGLILSDTQAIADSEEAKTKRETTALDVLQNGTSSFINGFMTKALSADASDETRHTLKNILDSQSPLAVASALRGMALRRDTSSVLAGTQLPILILTGDKDILISPSQSETMHSLSRNSKLVIIANAGHLSSLEKPVEWNGAVLDYFRN